MLIYQFVISLIAIWLTPVFIFLLLTRKEIWGWRLGIERIPYYNKKKIWLHAASVGEVNAVISLIERLFEHCPNIVIYLSTMTKTGFAQGKNIAQNSKGKIVPFILPIDAPWTIKRAVLAICPDILLITETEIWPNLIYFVKRKGTPVLLINARLSEKSLARYRKFKHLFSYIIRSIDIISAQSEIDKKRFSEFGHPRIRIDGNLKFAISLPYPDVNQIRKKWNVKAKFVITFGSSRPGEEELALGLHSFLQSHKIEHQIILAPRHLERLPQIEKLLMQHHINYAKLSDLQIPNDYSILLLDRMGELTNAYSVADIAIIGGSFYDFGGHNPLEAAYFGRPILIGPFHKSCQKSVEILNVQDAIEIVDKKELNEKVLFLYNNPGYRKKMGKNSKMVMDQNSSSLEKVLKIILNRLNYRMET
jgi:3-deoxy-D-manno-octulosonic-acid transferase